MEQHYANASSLNHSSLINGTDRSRRQPRQRSAKEGNGFGEFPLQMSSPQISTPQISNRRNELQSQSRIRLADNTKPPQSSGPRKQVLVLGPSSNDRRPAASPLQTNSLDFSMIATPGGGKQSTYLSTTPSEASASSAPSSGIWPEGTAFTNLLRGVVSSTPNVNPKKLLSATPYTAAREGRNQHEESQTIQSPDDNKYSALAFARSAPLSGYLRKLGKNIPTFKRRFFVLKPSTHLYYFMSPTDLEPRGCIDLDLACDKGERGGCEVREIGVLPDGTFRFELLFEDEVEVGATPEDEVNEASYINDNPSRGPKKREFQKQSVVLEARTEEIGREWMNKLQTERLSTARDEIDFLKTTLAEVKAQGSRWERIAADFETKAENAEKERDWAKSEAQSWEEKFNALNKAMGLLSDLLSNDEFTAESLAESVKGLDLNDTNFNNVTRAIKTIHNDYIVACETAEGEKQRADDLEKRLKAVECRLVKKEAELYRASEDNRTIQAELKKTKHEKKILVREVRAQRAKASDDSQNNQLSAQQESSCASTEQSKSQRQDSKAVDSECASVLPQRKFNSEQRKLVIELEEHVMSGLRLSEQFLTLNGIEPSVVGSEIDSCLVSAPASPEKRTNSHPLKESGVTTKLSSLLDDESNDEPTLPREEDSPTNANDEYILMRDNEIEESNKEVGMQYPDAADNKESVFYRETHNNDYSNSTRFNKSSIRHIAEMQAPDPYLFYKDLLDDKRERVSQNLDDRFNEVCTPIQHDDHHINIQSYDNLNDQVPPSDVESSVSGSTISRVTDTGHATSKLECPLRDVGETPRSYPPGSSFGEDNEVYHITFYSAKIGLQFQKVPMEKSSVGLLTDAMTADLVNRTASDLQRIVAIQNSQQNNNSKKDVMECPPVLPVDMVLVCGFVGFDESTGNARPRIGARLVAFDGITVEVGKWTFESIRKSIQARGRPLTLSFRNDYLTSKQREILTKAVNDVLSQDTLKPRTSAIFRGSSTRKAGIEKSDSITSKTSTVSSHSHRYYSFSEAGSSLTSAVAPLVSNLMTGLSAGKKKKQEEFTPDYLRRQTGSLNEIGHHHDFKSGLL